ncbi:Predicted N-acyltransferase, GNAT family [Cyclobacterium lianum]|uniref:Predicted N-acyltransferase, GNAT family n=1 Tax=Cyclobacterium lianum TaxID=388280 RepID=A0A1M7NC94_9BACT|nr:GNAT family N-acetyltransferase [Cyclobacterium lianum]SHN01313.1 Predicted N-acyltransferase, GNAT family [Cyclobacterium lianum]
MNIAVKKITDQASLQKAFAIREAVFVEEQQVAPEEEYDEYEQQATHFLALIGPQEAGTARWRFTDKGIKLERFAVLKAFRGRGVGNALVKAVLADINNHPLSLGKTVYLHGQVQAMGLYEKSGFRKSGELFVECNIEHYLMQLLPENSVK